MGYSRIMECVCGVTVEDFGLWRVDFKTGEAHSCRPQMADALEDITAQALAGQTDLDHWVAEVVETMLTMRDDR